jgi:hypothetical protein
MPILRTSFSQRILRLAQSIAKDIDSLYAVIRFADDEAKKIGLRHDVSVNIVPEITDARGITYENPIEHIAATAYPVMPGLGKWIADPTDPTGLTYHKEVLPVGKYYKASDDLDFEITSEYLENAPATFDTMVSNGNAVPYQMLHGGDGNKLGDVLQLYKAARSKELPNKPAGALSSKTREYVLRLAQDKAKVMTLDELAALLGITFADGMDDTAKLAAVKAWAAEKNGGQPVQVSQQPANGQQQLPNGVQGQPATQLAQGAPQQQQGAPNMQTFGNAATPNSQPFNPVMQQPQHNTGGQTITLPGLQGQSVQPQQIVVKLSKDSAAYKAVANGRQAQIDAAVNTYLITPAEGLALAQQHITEESVSLSLSAAAAPCPIAAYLDTRRQGSQAWSSSGRTPVDSQTAQGLALGGNNAGQNVSPLIANRMRREAAEEASRKATQRR